MRKFKGIRASMAKSLSELQAEYLIASWFLTVKLSLMSDEENGAQQHEEVSFLVKWIRASLTRFCQFISHRHDQSIFSVLYRDVFLNYLWSKHRNRCSANTGECLHTGELPCICGSRRWLFARRVPTQYGENALEKNSMHGKYPQIFRAKWSWECRGLSGQRRKLIWHE